MDKPAPLSSSPSGRTAAPSENAPGASDASRFSGRDASAALAQRMKAHPFLGALTVGLLFVALFILVRPYQGIRHDAILYTAQALHNAHPENFRNDLFFVFGSQDDWTLYGKLYEHVVASIGVRAGNLLGIAVVHLLWWSGIWRLARRLLPAPWHWIAVLFVVAMPPDYGDAFSFFYAEPWLTARVPAEALCLWALAFAIERRLIIAFVLALASITLHPLNGAVGFIAVLLVAAPRGPWWRIFAVVLVLFAALQYATPAWFAVHPLDSAWRQILETEVSYLFPSQWTVFAWSKACWIIALPLVLHAGDRHGASRHAASGASGPAGRVTVPGLWGGLALIGLTGMTCATLADIGGHDALWIQLQTWRVLWLLSVMQWPALAILLLREWQARPGLIWLLALCWLTADLGGGIVGLAIAALLHVAPLLQRAKPDSRLVAGFTAGFTAGFGALTQQLGDRQKRWYAALTVLAIALWALCQVALGVSYMAARQGPMAWELSWLEMILHSRFMAVLLGLLCVMFLLGRRGAVCAFYVILAGLLAYGAINIDQRATTMRIMEARLDTPSLAPFHDQVAPGKLVYWDGPWHELVYPWLLMRTASYFFPAQASGIVFHRQTTFEALRRAVVIGGPHGTPQAANDPQTAASIARSPLKPDTVPGENFLLSRRLNLFTPLTPEAIRRVCSASSREPPAVDFVVSPRHYADIADGAHWDVSATQRYWLYDCKRINALSSLSSAPDVGTGGPSNVVTHHRNQRGEAHAIG